ncbi:hypothetical protein [Mucilaginibacter sp. CSA2-8R]|uniref:hypothetical protein n=1 Tax=Mucilaginibacter sp. CSA2-8R TaxID=3141542 RepID=UPI00315DD908
MKIHITSWQQIKYGAYRYYLVEDRFFYAYVFSGVLCIVGLYLSLLNHMDPIYTGIFILGVMFFFFYPFMPLHWKLFRHQTLTINLTGSMMHVYKNGITYSIDLNRYGFKKVAGHYVLCAGDQVFFFTSNQFEELRQKQTLV